MDLVVGLLMVVALLMAGDVMLAQGKTAFAAGVLATNSISVVVMMFAVIGVLATCRSTLRSARRWWLRVKEHHLTRTVIVERPVIVERIVEKPVLLVDREIQLRTALAHLPFSQEEKDELLAYVMEETRQLPKKLGNG